ncbi:PREDICTED: selenoprotein S, partial [Fulmarus glacialis]|uniref:selenoprotein S n=1 Tax=Fulmarus glacialis TaxID=30455 RepID=UPI00051C8641
CGIGCKSYMVMILPHLETRCRKAQTVLRICQNKPDMVVRRQEALAAARLRMQEELNAQAERYKEKQRQLEEEKRRQKIAMWESMQEGKSYKGNLKLNQQEVESGASTSSAVPKSKPNKKPLRGGGYNPLSGEGGGTCSWRPGRRGPSAGG